MGNKQRVAIQWPAIVKLAGSDELLYLDNAIDWLSLANLNRAHFISPADQLVDSAGQRYFIHTNAGSNLPRLQQHPTTLALQEMISWVQHHANALGHCCVSKLSFTSLSQGLQIVRSLAD
ncbi:MAG: DUF4144 family protein [Shewanella sp.]